MPASDDSRAGEVEWLDFGPEPNLDAASSARGHRPWWYGLLAIALVVAFVLVHGHKTPKRVALTAKTSAAPSAAPPSSPPPTTLTPPSTQTPSRQVVELGHPVLDVPASWQLFGQGSGTVIRLALKQGEVTSTTLPTVQSRGPVAFLASPDSVLVQPLDPVNGYVVPDGRTAVTLPAVFQRGGPVLPGPDRDHVWVSTNASLMSLVGFDGASTGVSIPIPADAGVPISDGTGYIIFFGTGGVYDARPGAVRRVTTGYLLAAGPTRWLVTDCDDQHRCGTYVVDRATGRRTVLTLQSSQFVPGAGVISPDGATAALMQSDADGKLTLHLVDLASGVDRNTTVLIDDSLGFEDNTVVWSPDSKWLFGAGDSGRLLAVARGSGQPTDLGIDVPINQIALRTG